MLNGSPTRKVSASRNSFVTKTFSGAAATNWSYFDAVRKELDEYFHGRRQAFEMPVDWRLSHGFHLKAREACYAIPFGGVLTYAELAAAAGSPRAVRAAGQAMARNPVPIVVPCHRVLRTGGGLGGYGGGLDVKRWLLDLERGERLF